MIGKQEKGRSFRGCLRYVFEKEGAQFLGGNMLGETIDELAAEFNAIRRLHPGLEVVVYHAMLSLPAHERRTDEQWFAIATNYLKEMGFGSCQFIAVRHTDEEHDHIHIVTNRIKTLDAKVVSDSNDYARSEAVIRKLEQIYNLEQATSSYEQLDRAPTTGEIRKFEHQQKQFDQGIRAAPPDPCIRLVLQTMVKQLSQEKPTMPQLIEQLQERGVEVRVEPTKAQELGISYGFAGQHYSGTQLGKGYTFQGLQKYRDIDYESERDDEAIGAICSGRYRPQSESAAIAAANERVDAVRVEVDRGTVELEAAIRRLDFATTTFATTTGEFRDQPLQFETSDRELFEAIQGYVEYEAIESIAESIGEFSSNLERNQRGSRQTDEIRRGIEKFDRSVTANPEQILLRLRPAGSQGDDQQSEELGRQQWLEQKSQRYSLYKQYAHYGRGLGDLEKRDLAIAQGAFDDEIPETDVFWMLASGHQAEAVEKEQGRTGAERYLQETVRQAQILLQQLLQEWAKCGYNQASLRRNRQRYADLREKVSAPSAQVDGEVAKQVMVDSEDWENVLADVLGQGRNARRIAYQHGIDAWEAYVNTTLDQVEQAMLDQPTQPKQKTTSRSTTEDQL